MMVQRVILDKRSMVGSSLISLILAVVVVHQALVTVVQLGIRKLLIFSDICIIGGRCVFVFRLREQLWVAEIVPLVSTLLLHAAIGIDEGPWQFQAILLGLH